MGKQLLLLPVCFPVYGTAPEKGFVLIMKELGLYFYIFFLKPVSKKSCLSHESDIIHAIFQLIVKWHGNGILLELHVQYSRDRNYFKMPTAKVMF